MMVVAGSQAANVIDQMPYLIGSDSGLSVHTFHRRAEAVANIDENLAICGPMVPLLVG